MLNIGTDVYCFEIKLDFKKDTVTTQDKGFKIIGTNEECFVINDQRFTTLSYKISKYSIYTDFRKVSVHHFNCLSYYDEVTGTLYTHNPSKKIAFKAIKKSMEKFLYDKYGKYCQGVSLLKSI